MTELRRDASRHTRRPRSWADEPVGDPGADGDDDLAARLARVAVPTVIVTLGALGCVARTGATMLHQPGFAVEPLDTTAAGDTFCGALVAAISQGDALAQALRRACAAAALACTRMGAQPSIPLRAEVDAFLDRAGA